MCNQGELHDVVVTMTQTECCTEVLFSVYKQSKQKRWSSMHLLLQLLKQPKTRQSVTARLILPI